MTAPNQDFEMWAGDSKKLLITVYEPDGSTMDLTGATVVWALQGQDDEAPLVTKSTTEVGEIIMTGAANGIVEVRLVPADTETLGGSSFHEVKRYFHELEITASGTVSTVTAGTVQIHRSIA